MDLSPNDIRSFEFASQMRGYSKEEVDTFLDQVADAMESLKQENLKLSMELDSSKSQLSGLRQFEDTIKSAAIDARRNADMTVENAKKEADLILSKARAETQELFGNRTKKLADLEQQIQDLGLTKKSYLSKLQNLIKSHMAMIDEADLGDFDQKRMTENIEVTDSSEVGHSNLETIGTSGPEVPAIITEEAGVSGTDDSVVEKTPLDTAESGVESKPVDPELAAALEQYKAGPTPVNAPAKATEVVDKPADSSPESATVTPIKQWVETNRRAEDIPDGFFAKPALGQAAGDTDKIGVDGKSGQPQANLESGGPVSGGDNNAAKNKPLDIAGELDNVAKKFAEEMDKAEKS